MGRAALIFLWLAGLLALGVLWWGELQPPIRTGERATAEAVAARLEGFVEERATVVRELADRFSAWESLPEAAVGDALRSFATRYLGLDRLLLADPAGRLVAGYDAARRLGKEALPAGSLDPVLGRRDVLAGARRVLVLPSAQAGRLQQLELAAAIRRADGTRPGYVGATVGLGALRAELDRLAETGLRIGVTTAGGDVLYPCRGRPATEGARARSPRFVVRVAARAAPRTGRRAVGLLATLCLLAALLLGTRAFTRLDRASQMGKSDR